MPDQPRDPELDKTLSEFLDDHVKDKRKGYTLANLFAEMNEYRKEQTRLVRRVTDLEESSGERDERTEEAHDRLDAHRGAIVAVKRHLRHVAPKDNAEFDEEMDTGKFDVVAIEREVRDLRARRINSDRVKAEEITWWKRNIISLVIGVLGFVAATAITVLITIAVRSK